MVCLIIDGMKIERKTSRSVGFFTCGVNDFKMVVKMNVINLKTLSLSVLMASSMISGAFAMDPDGGIDTSNPIGSVKAASAKFGNGDSPVRRTPQASQAKLSEGEGASGFALVLLNEQKEAKTKIARLKEDADAIKTQLEQEVNAARASAAQKIVEIENHRKEMELAMEAQRQLLQTQLNELGTEVSSKRSELYQLTSDLEAAKKETAAVKEDALLTRSGVAAMASRFNPLSYLGRGTPSSKPE